MRRYYNKKGRKFPSVTTIIADCSNNSAPLIQWGANCVVEWIRQNCEKKVMTDMIALPLCFKVYEDDLNKARFEFRNVSKEALDIGSEVHNAIEQYLLGRKCTLTTKRAKKSFQAFLDWQKEVNLKPIELEQTVWGDRWAGTLDFVGYYKDKVYVIDWKTSKAFYPEMKYQVAAYRSTWSQFDESYIEGCGILRLDKEFGIPYFKDTSKSYLDDLATFNAMVDLFFLRHPLIRKRFNNT